MTEKVKINDYILEDKLRKIIDKNVVEIPYEGKEIGKEDIVVEIMQLLTNKEYSLLRHEK